MRRNLLIYLKMSIFRLLWGDRWKLHREIQRNAIVTMNTDSEHSLIFLKGSEVTRILWAWRSRDTRDSCLASLPLHALKVGQRQDTLLLMRYWRFNGYLNYLNTFINMVRTCLFTQFRYGRQHSDAIGPDHEIEVTEETSWRASCDNSIYREDKLPLGVSLTSHYFLDFFGQFWSCKPDVEHLCLFVQITGSTQI